MKKTFIISILLFASYLAQAQVNPHAIGIRLGGNGNINGAEVSYQHGLSERNRLEFDLGVGGNNNHARTSLIGVFHWDWNITKGLNWYVGPGVALGFHTYRDGGNYVNVGLGGQIGLEYDFNSIGAPILISIDGRPMWDFLGDVSGLGWGAALGVRYTWPRSNNN